MPLLPRKRGGPVASLFSGAVVLTRHDRWRFIIFSHEKLPRGTIGLLIMAWRIQDNVVRGEVDNRARGVVRGKLWLHGRADPVELELRGNACADLAGCLLTFENLGATQALPPDAELHTFQRGTIGDLTASRKVRVCELSEREVFERRKQNRQVPERLANCLYLEWFSASSGRVVIESTEYKLAISPPAWRLSPGDEKQRTQDAAQGFSWFLQKLNDKLRAEKHPVAEAKEWDEFDYERFMRESDARTDKYGELFDKYQDHPDRDRIIALEMGWTWLEAAPDEEAGDGNRPPRTGNDEPARPARERGADAEDGDEDGFDFEPPEGDTDLEPDPATEGVDWVRAGDGHLFHPLSLRALEGSIALHHKYKELELDRSGNEDLTNLIGEYRITAAKLAGALDSLAYGRDLTDGAFIVAYLKRALGRLHAAQAALERVATNNLLPAECRTSLRAEFFALREEILRLMEDFRRNR